MNGRSEKRVACVTARHRGLCRTVAQDTRSCNQRRLSDASDLLSRSYLHDLHTTTLLYPFLDHIMNSTRNTQSNGPVVSEASDGVHSVSQAIYEEPEDMDGHRHNQQTIDRMPTVETTRHTTRTRTRSSSPGPMLNSARPPPFSRKITRGLFVKPKHQRVRLLSYFYPKYTPS
jgi:hypothetical protein